MFKLDQGSRVDRWLLSRFLTALGPRPIRLVLHGSEASGSPIGVPVATLRIRDRRTMASLYLDPEVAFGDAYSEGRIEVEGDLLGLIETAYRSPLGTGPRGWFARGMSALRDWFRANSPRGSRRNIHQHYDLGTDFFRLWLDRRLAYTCAYYPTPSTTLDEAQEAKMDHVCRKLQLQRGETVVEAGCGWGSLALHMARQYGVRVRAFNISHDQISEARRMAAAEGLAGAVEFVEDDYRNIRGTYDAFVSVGMLEHVGANHYREMGDVVRRSIGRSGRGLLHFIGRNQAKPLSSWIRKRIFPGAYVPALREVMAMLEPYGFAILDVENLRRHYAKTLEEWRERFERSFAEVAAMFDMRFARAWRLYLCGSIAAFRVGNLQLFQVVFAGPDSQWMPWTRAHLYAGTAEPAHEQAAKWMNAMS